MRTGYGVLAAHPPANQGKTPGGFAGRSSNGLATARPLARDRALLRLCHSAIPRRRGGSPRGRTSGRCSGSAPSRLTSGRTTAARARSGRRAPRRTHGTAHGSPARRDPRSPNGGCTPRAAAGQSSAWLARVRSPPPARVLWWLPTFSCVPSAPFGSPRPSIRAMSAGGDPVPRSLSKRSVARAAFRSIARIRVRKRLRASSEPRLGI